MHPTIPLSQMIQLVVAPVVLISANAILLSGFSAKYASIADQMRRLAAEYRADGAGDKRKTTIRQELRFFHRRVNAVWAATALLLMSLVCFLVTVLGVVAAQRTTWAAFFCLAMIVLGVFLMFIAASLELYEIRLARLTMAGELSDILTGKDD